MMTRALSIDRLLGVARRTLLRLTYVALACRVIVPAGFMPAALDDGGPIAICHGGAAGRLLASLHIEAAGEARGAHPESQHHGSDHSGSHHPGSQHGSHHRGSESSGDGAATEEYDVWEHCQLGNVFGTMGPAFEIEFANLDFRHVLPSAVRPAFLAVSPVRAYRARAPPHRFTSHS